MDDKVSQPLPTTGGGPVNKINQPAGTVGEVPASPKTTTAVIGSETPSIPTTVPPSSLGADLAVDQPAPDTGDLAAVVDAVDQNIPSLSTVFTQRNNLHDLGTLFGTDFLKTLNSSLPPPGPVVDSLAISQRMRAGIAFGFDLISLIARTTLNFEYPPPPPKFDTVQFPNAVFNRSNTSIMRMLAMEIAAHEKMFINTNLLAPDQVVTSLNLSSTTPLPYYYKVVDPSVNTKPGVSGKPGAPGDTPEMPPSLPQGSFAALASSLVASIFQICESDPDPQRTCTAKRIQLNEVLYRWDLAIVDFLNSVSPYSASGKWVNAYDVGRSLSKTDWVIKAAENSPGGGTDATIPYKLFGLDVPASLSTNFYAECWRAAFSPDRIDRVQRQLLTLGEDIDPVCLRAINASLNYWQNVIFQIYTLTAPEIKDPNIKKVNNKLTLRLDKKTHDAVIYPAFGIQMGNWYDALTGRRDLKYFTLSRAISELFMKTVKRIESHYAYEFSLVFALITALGVAFVAFVHFDPFHLNMGLSFSESAASIGGFILTGLSYIFGKTFIGNMNRTEVSVKSEADSAVSGAERTASSLKSGVARIASGGGPVGALLGTELQAIISSFSDDLSVERVNLAMSEPLIDVCFDAYKGDLRGLLELLGTNASSIDSIRGFTEGIWHKMFDSLRTSFGQK